MMCYRDMTFCASPNCVNACGRQLSEKEKKAIPKWLVVSYATFCDSEGRYRDKNLQEESPK